MNRPPQPARYLTDAPGLLDWAKTLPIYPVPQHAFSRLVHRVTRIRVRWLRRLLTAAFIRYFGVDMSEAVEPDPMAYAHFNDFFTRALRPGIRPPPENAGAICSPADGAISALGPINDDAIIQAKGHKYSLTTLLGGDPGRAHPFRDGNFVTIYLSPRNYHRVHIPLAGQLREMVHVPGRLFSVGRHTVRTVPELFARNERVACLFDTDAGAMAVVLVGAIGVGSIETVWAGEVTPPRGHSVRVTSYGPQAPAFGRGDEIGRFNMGSTAVVLFGPGMAELDANLQVDEEVRVRQQIGRLLG